MKPFHLYMQRAAIALGLGAAIGLAGSWYFNPKSSCVRTLSKAGKPAAGQEVVYSWGCLQPQRFRQWSVIALNHSAIERAQHGCAPIPKDSSGQKT